MKNRSGEKRNGFYVGIISAFDRKDGWVRRVSERVLNLCFPKIYWGKDILFCAILHLFFYVFLTKGFPMQ